MNSNNVWNNAILDVPNGCLVDFLVYRMSQTGHRNFRILWTRAVNQASKNTFVVIPVMHVAIQRQARVGEAAEIINRVGGIWWKCPQGFKKLKETSLDEN